jgi:hypothetical protein
MTQTMIRSRRRGQVFLEFALVLPICLMMFTAMVDLGIYLHRYLSIQTAVREGIRAAADGRDDKQVQAIVLSASDDTALKADEVQVVRIAQDPQLASLDPGDGGAPIAMADHGRRYESVELRVLTHHKYLVPLFFPGEGWTRIAVICKTVRPLK